MKSRCGILIDWVWSYKTNLAWSDKVSVWKSCVKVGVWKSCVKVSVWKSCVKVSVWKSCVKVVGSECVHI